jgi:uncharacterized protein YkwD
MRIAPPPKKLLQTIVLLSLLYIYALPVRKLSRGVLGSTTDLSPAVVLSQVNLLRTQYGLSTLQVNRKLEAAAEAKATDMISRGYFAHQYQDQDAWVFLNQSGYAYLHAGENLAQDFTNTEELIASWLDSPGHRDIMLSPVYSESGVGIVAKSTGKGVVIVQYFASPGDSNLLPQTVVQTDPVSPNKSNVSLFVVAGGILILAATSYHHFFRPKKSALATNLWRLS